MVTPITNYQPRDLIWTQYQYLSTQFSEAAISIIGKQKLPRSKYIVIQPMLGCLMILLLELVNMEYYKNLWKESINQLQLSF